LTAIRHNPIIKAFPDTLMAERKHKKTVIVPCERKLAMICYGVLKSGEHLDSAALFLHDQTEQLALFAVAQGLSACSPV